MGKKSGSKRKKDTNSPNQSGDQENKRILMSNMNSYNGSSPIQGMSQPGQYMAPATFHYTPSMGGMGGMTSMLGQACHFSGFRPEIIGFFIALPALRL